MELAKIPLVGCDPEFFVKTKVKKKWVNVSAHELVEGTKEAPMLLDGGAVQVDGTALEFNINPAKNEKEFMGNIDLVLEQVRALIPDDYQFDFSAVAQYTNKYMDTLPDYAKELGCDPDYNAYTGGMNYPPDGEADFRTGAGHIHVGIVQEADIHNPLFFLACRQLVHMMDVYVGIPLAYLEPANKRNQLYGKAGAFRPKPYGVEWRTGSNFWLQSKSLRRMVYRQTVRAYKALVQNNHPHFRTPIVRYCINSPQYRRETIRQMLTRYPDIFPKSVTNLRGMPNV